MPETTITRQGRVEGGAGLTSTGGASRKRVQKARGTATASAGLLQLPHRRKDNERPNELEEWLKAQQRLIRNAEARQANEKPDKERQAEAMKALGMRAISTYFTAKRKEGVG
jgi:hypothetical protein